MSNGRLVVLIGERVGSSLSPAIWNQVFRDCAVPLRYESRSVPAASLLREIAQLRAPGIAAANVTMPYKAKAAELADVRDADAERVGATNFLVNRSGMLHAANTDVAAVRFAVRHVAPRTVLIMGAGGAGRAALGGIGNAAAHVVIADREDAAARDLSHLAQGRGMRARAVAWGSLPEVVPRADLIVNATPIGMDRSSRYSPIPGELLAHRPLVYDFVYSDQLTPLLAVALEAGCRVTDGIAHLTRQAVAMIPGLGLSPDAAEAIPRAVADAANRKPLTWE